MPLETRPFDPAEYIDDAPSIAAYLSDAFAGGDAAEIADAIGVVARARGMTQLAAEAGLSRTSLYRALSTTGKPELPTVLAIMRALGVQLTVTPGESMRPAGYYPLMTQMKAADDA